jgi:DNA-nicking Smr family endonuclease
MAGKKKNTSRGRLNQLEDLLQEAGIRLKSQEAPPPLPARNPGKPAPVPGKPPAEASDEEIFSKAMNGVERASWKHTPYPLSKPVRPAESDSEAEGRMLMQEALDLDTPIPILEHPEYIEGWIGVAGKRFLPNLRSGLYSIQGQIDLHGMNREEAMAAVEEYVARMSRFRSCCVKIIHGRGINSPADRATLKESLQRFLSTRKMARYVVAYASAPALDGGVGCVYVLLSRQSR